MPEENKDQAEIPQPPLANREQLSKSGERSQDVASAARHISESLDKTAHEHPEVDLRDEQNEMEELNEELQHLVHPQDIIQDKTSDVLRSQARLVAWRRQRYSETPISFPDNAFTMAPADFKEFVKQQRQAVEDGEESPFLEEYDRYVQSLRTLRESQREQITQEVKEALDPREQREIFLRNITFSSELASTLLQNMEDWDWYAQTARVFSEDQLNQARKSEEDFLHVFREGIKASPISLFRVIDAAKIILPADEINATLQKAREDHPALIITQFKEYAEVMPPEEQKTQIETLLRNNDYAHLVISTLEVPEIAALFEHDELRDLIIQGALSMPNSFFSLYRRDDDATSKFLQRGDITEDDMRDIVLKSLGNSKITDASNALQYTDLFTGEKEDELKAVVVAAFLREENPLDLSSLQRLGNLIDDEQKKAVFMKHLDREPQGIFLHLELMEQYITHDEIASLLRREIANRTSNFVRNSGIAEVILTHDYLSADEKRDYRRILFHENPNEAFQNMELYLEDIPDGERPALVKNAAMNSRTNVALEFFREWAPYATTDPEQQKQLILEIVQKDEGLQFVRSFVRDDGALKDGLLLTRDEIQKLVQDKVEHSEYGVFIQKDALKAVHDLVETDKAYKEFIDKASLISPDSFLAYYKDIAYLYRPPDSHAFIDHIFKSLPRSAETCIRYFNTWKDSVDRKYVTDFIKENSPQYATSFLGHINEFIPYIETEQQEPYLQELIQASPPAALYDNDKLHSINPRFSQEEIIRIALADNERLSLAPRTFAEFYKKASGFSDITEKTALLTEMDELYSFITKIRMSNIRDTHKQVQAQQDLSKRQEKELLANFASIAMVKEKDPEKFNDLKETAQTPDSIAQIVFEELGQRLGLDRVITAEERQRFFDSMETPSPFLLYLLQYEDSPVHKELLANMADGILQGSYDGWKYGPLTQQHVETLKEQQLLPAISLEQYRAWSEDESSTLFESLAANAETTGKEVKQILIDNAEHLESDVFGLTDAEVESSLREVQTEISLVGRELGDVNKRLGILRRESGDLSSEEAVRLFTEKADLETRKNDLAKNRNLMKLLMIKPEEIVSGYFFEGNTRKRATKLGKVLEELRVQVPQEGQFVLDRAKLMLEGFHQQNQEKQDLLTTDSSNPKVLIEVGAKPVGSCQHYAHGEFNECLLGYSDPNTKIVTLSNDRGNLVARAIFRMLSKEDGTAALHLERIYSVSVSTGVTRAIYAHATQKAERLGMPLFISREAQNAEGQMVEAEHVPGFALEDTEDTLSSKASRAPFSYVDSVGGKVKNSVFTLNKLQSLQTAA